MVQEVPERKDIRRKFRNSEFSFYRDRLIWCKLLKNIILLYIIYILYIIILLFSVWCMAAIKTEFLNSEFIGSSFQQTPPKTMLFSTCPIFNMKTAFFHPKRLKIWNRFENFVPLHCQQERWILSAGYQKFVFRPDKIFCLPRA